MLTKPIVSWAGAIYVALSFACHNPRYHSSYPQTTDIDTGIYKELNKKFRVSAGRAPDYLGGLTPNYPIAIGTQLVFDFHGHRLIKDTDWVSGFFVPSARKIIIKAQNDYILINNRSELQKTYAPISTKEEALAYAMLYYNCFAVFEDFYRKKTYRFVNKPDTSYTIKKGDNFLVKLFRYQAFGCDHPYSAITMQVNQNGMIKISGKTISFYDPADDHICVD